MRDPFYDDTFLAEDASAGDRAFADFLGSRNAALASMPEGGIAQYTPPPAEDLPALGEMFIQPTPSPVQAPPQMASVSAPEEFQGLPPPPPPAAEPSPPLPDFGPGNPLYNPAMAGLSDFFANARPETFRGPDGGLDPRFLVPNYRTAADIPAEPAAPFPTSYEPAPPLAPAPPPPGLTGGDFQSWEPPAPFIPPAEPGPPPAAPFIPPAAPAPPPAYEPPPVFDAPPRVIREREREREDLWMPPDPRTVAGDRPGLGYRPTPPPDLPPLGTLLPEPEPAAPPPSPPPAPPAQPAPVELPPEPAPYSPPIREREPTPPVPVPVPQPKIPPPAPPPTDLPPVAPPPPMTTMPIPGFTPEPAPPPPPPGLISSPVPQLPPAQPPVAPPAAQPPQGFDFGSLPSWMFDEGTDLGRLLRRIRGRGSRTTLSTSGTGGSSMPGAAPGQPGGGIAIPTAGAVPTPQGYGGSGQIPIGGNVPPVPMPGMFGSIGSGGAPAMGGGGLGSLPPPPGLTPGLAQGSVPGLSQNPNLSPGVLGGAGMMGYYRDRMGNIIASPGAGLFGGSVPGFAEGGTVSKEDIRRRAREYMLSEPGTQPLVTPSREDIGDFWSGVKRNLGPRVARGAQLLAELSSPAYMAPKPAMRQLAEDVAGTAAAAVKDPRGFGEQMVRSEVDRALGAMEGPEAMGEYLASYLSPTSFMRGPLSGKAEPVSNIKGYHVSMSPFKEFDPEKINTGFGAQAHGYGHYLGTDRREISELGYNLALGKKKARVREIQKLMQAEANTPGSSGLPFESIERALEYEKSGKNPPVYLHTFDVPDEMHRGMLDWNQYYSKQPASVRAALDQYFLERTGRRPVSVSERTGNLIDSPGWSLYESLKLQGVNPRVYGDVPVKDRDPRSVTPDSYREASRVESRRVAEDLQSRGIPGIRYEGGTSVYRWPSRKNVVVFPGEEKNVKLLDREELNPEIPFAFYRKGGEVEK